MTINAGPEETAAANSSRGFVFATTGDRYGILARRAARTLRQSMPDAVIDWFTDDDVQDDIFDKIHRLERSWERPKIEAVRRSRFVRTVYLDADVIVLHPVPELFEILETFEFFAAHDRSRAQRFLTNDPAIPRAAPHFNSGVLGCRSTPATQTLLHDWERAMLDNGDRIDQPSLRRLLYTTEIRLLALPIEYNLYDQTLLDIWLKWQGAPRILHLPALHRAPPGDPMAAFDLTEAVGRRKAAMLDNMARADWSLGGDPDAVVMNPMVEMRARVRKRQNMVDRITRALGRR